MTLTTPDTAVTKAQLIGGNLTAAWIVLATSCIVWPFSWSGFSSQILGACMLLPCLMGVQHWPEVAKRFFGLAWMPYLLLCGILVWHLVQDGEHSELLVFMAYLLKIPALGLLTYGAMQTLHRLGFSPSATMQVFWLAVILPLTVMLFQLLVPSFHEWSIGQLGGFRVEQVISGNHHGHPFRFLGPNGFLFSSHGVAFAFTALGLLVSRTTKGGRAATYPFFCIEIACLLAALLSGRSALPLLGIYILASLFFAYGLRQRLSLCLIYLVIGALLAMLPKVSKDGEQLITWLLEPIRTSLERGTLSSASLDVTLESYQGLSAQSPQPTSQESFSFHAGDLLKPSSLFGQGVYFRDNEQYKERGLTFSDSGFVRLIYLVGYLGCTLFLLFWSLLFIYTWRRSRNSPPLSRSYLALFTIYGLIFFVKSEWLYQNFFIFYFFLLFHHFNSAANHNHAYHIRQSVAAAT
ncbi:hypothetical protein QP575_01485 [Alcaligenes faecalis subsp. phenolicus]|uniref:hypothetical protein n=1 Tax=Alcaligenes nematophilus TaxID=2994643 RepID=UPI002AA4EF46|nr:hypothetical protein [Alcaligenes phenolicus]